MPFDFERLARRALDNGGVDNPNKQDLSEEITDDSMTRLANGIHDLCAVSNVDEGLDPANIICVLCTVLAQAIVNQTTGPAMATRLFRDVTGAIADAVFLQLTRKDK